MAVCMTCGKGFKEGVSLFRVNEKGQSGIWACESHFPKEKKIDPTVYETVSAIEKGQTPPGSIQ